MRKITIFCRNYQEIQKRQIFCKNSKNYLKYDIIMPRFKTKDYMVKKLTLKDNIV